MVDGHPTEHRDFSAWFKVETKAEVTENAHLST